MLIFVLVLLFGSASYVALWRYRSLRDSELRRYFISYMLNGTNYSVRYSSGIHGVRSNRAKFIAAQSIAHLSSIIYRIDETPLLEVSRALKLERFLLDRAVKRRGVARVESLMLLWQVPSDELVVDELDCFANDNLRVVRFLAMMCAINIERERFIHHLSKFRGEFSPFELSFIVDMLRRGELTIAYQPLLASPSCNLNLVGIAVVRQFGIETASDMVAELAEQSSSPRVRSMAIDALTAMHMPVAITSLKGYLSSLRRPQRFTLLRHIAASGYSEKALLGVVAADENRYYRTIINSYKVKLRCY